MKKSIFLWMLISGYTLISFAQEQILPVVPQPQEVRFTKDKFLANNEEFGIKFFMDEDEPVKNAISELKETFKKFKRAELSAQNNSAKKILAGIPASSMDFRKLCGKYDMMPEVKLGEEGYKLLISPDTVLISANNSKGIFYGIQTLKQIVRGTNDSYLPGVRITDWPALKCRIVMDDISRGPVPTMDFMKYQIRRLAELKINYFTHYVEHVVRTKSHPEFAPVDGSFSIEEWKEISEYAAKYNVILAGNFQSFGHFNNILNTPQYLHLGESGTLISPVLPESYKFLEDIYSEMIPAFKAPFFNINCDETFDLGKGASKKLVDSIGYAGAYYEHIMRLYAIITKFGSKVFMWGDVLLEYPELLKKLPKDIFIGTWTYDDLDSYSEFIDPIKEAGFQFFVTPGVLNSNKLFPLYKQAFGNIKGFIRAAVNSGALGAITTVWDDGGNALFSNDWYGVTYAADKSWNPDSEDSSDFDSRFNSGIYGSRDNSLTAAIWKLNELAELESADGLTDKVIFEKLLPEQGRQIKISTIDWQKVITISNEAEKILQKTSLNNYAGDKDYLQFICELYNTLAEERFDLLKAVDFYSKADSVFKNQPAEAKNYILKSINLLERIIEREKYLKARVEKLWLLENHTYALDRITKIYQSKIDGFDDVKSRIAAVLKQLEISKSLASKDEVRLSISGLPGKYFREWLMISPLPNKENLPLSQFDYLAGMGGELNAVPKVTQEIYYDSVKYRWTRVSTQYQDAVNLSEIFDKDNSGKVVYAFATIEAKKDTSVTVSVGFDEGLEVILNGKSVFKKISDGTMIPDKDRFPLPLRKGINNLMLKSSQTNGDWGFSFRITDSEVRSRKNRYRIISD